MTKRVFCYSTMHTGTWFTIHLLESAVNSSTGLLGDAEIELRGRKYKLEDEKTNIINKEWFKRNIEDYMSEEEKEKELYIAHGHHRNLNSTMPSIVSNHSISQEDHIPIVIPMRDPLLSLNTFIWREHADYDIFIKTESKEDRAARAHLNIELTKDMLEIPRDCFSCLLPIDINDKNNIHTAERALNHCNLPLTKKAMSYIEKWAPQNKSENAPRVTNKEHNNSGFHKIKELYKNKDKNGLRDMLSVEMDIIERDDNLKLLLEEVGYTNLPWW